MSLEGVTGGMSRSLMLLGCSVCHEHRHSCRQAGAPGPPVAAPQAAVILTMTTGFPRPMAVRLRYTFSFNPSQAVIPLAIAPVSLCCATSRLGVASAWVALTRGRLDLWLP
jgi:hypothetical protein